MAADSAPDSATSKVFDTVELLERIIANLPCKDGFIVQRVSTFWKATIAASPTLQRGLFLMPAAKSIPDLDYDKSTIDCNISSPGPTIEEWSTVNDMLRGIGTASKAAVSNGYPTTPEDVYKACADAPRSLKYMNPFVTPIFETVEDMNGFAFALDSRMLRSQGIRPSWEKMLVSQPPAATVFISHVPEVIHTYSTKCREGLLGENGEHAALRTEKLPIAPDGFLNKESGITLGDLVASMEKEAGRLEEDGLRGDDDVPLFFQAYLGTSNVDDAADDKGA